MLYRIVGTLSEECVELIRASLNAGEGEILIRPEDLLSLPLELLPEEDRRILLSAVDDLTEDTVLKLIRR
ncbi:hypothetical protein [Thermococcus sp. CX2]|uniref:hypothetical protein n=1 Tax=Thermococcus sp. CX2 TaxID=163006 RepID=UPI00197F01B3|nr:hypothetical protein [Thermococcus sp. CX2]